MKYKSFSRIFLSVSLLCGYGAVSPVSANNALPTSTPIQAEAHTALRQTRDSIRQSLLLLGEDDSHADQYVPGSTKNYAADGSTLIGRIYVLPLFGETAQAGTLYDANGKTNVVTIPLASPQAEPYSKVLRKLYGTPTAVQNTPSEGGATWEEWTLGKNNIRLYQEYGLSTLDLTRKADITSYNTQRPTPVPNWRKPLSHTTAVRKKNGPARAMPIIKLILTVMVPMKFSLSSPDHTPVEPAETPPYGDASIKEISRFISLSL